MAEIQNHIESYWDDLPDGAKPMLPGGQLFGRLEILTGVDEITRENLPMVLSECLSLHWWNSAQIDYLWRYNRGMQPILNRKKEIRPEINNRVVENHANEISKFTAAYFMGEPVVYVRRDDREDKSEDIQLLNDYMYYEDLSTRNMEMATWMAVCGVGYRMVLPDADAFGEEDDAPFEIDTPDPRFTFVAYSSGFGHRAMMGVRIVWKQDESGNYRWLYCGYTKTHYFEAWDGANIVKWESHTLGTIPIFEYRLNSQMLGSFEPAIPLLDAINNIQSNRVDGLEQFVQSFLKFINCDIETDTVEQLRKMGAIVIKSTNGLESDVQIVSQELNQQQVQTMVDYLYDQVLYICGVPTSTKGGASTSDTGQAVYLRDGWGRCEQNAKETEKLYEKPEREFLKLVLRIMGETRETSLKAAEIKPHFTRRQTDNLQTKCQALTSMLQAGIHPEIALATSGLFNDPMDVYTQSKRYLAAKWEPIVMTADDESDTPDETDEFRDNQEKIAKGAKESGDQRDGKKRCVICGGKLPPGRNKYDKDVCMWEANRMRANGLKIPEAGSGKA